MVSFTVPEQFVFVHLTFSCVVCVECLLLLFKPSEVVHLNKRKIYIKLSRDLEKPTSEIYEMFQKALCDDSFCRTETVEWYSQVKI